MMGVIKKTALVILVISLVTVGMGGVGYMLFYDSFTDFVTDVQTVKRTVRLELFRKGVITKIDQDDVRHIYQTSCYRKCHGESAMITAVLSPAGWLQVVERMRLKEKVDITGAEADAIVKYLEETYPTTKSGYPFEIRKKTHNAVWRNDMGQGDIYCDVIYTTPEYLRAVGAAYLIDEYDVKHYHVFIVTFSVHDGEIEPENLDKVTFMRSSTGTIKPAPPWKLRFQTADKHHYEGVVRFRRDGKIRVVGPGVKWFEFVVHGVGIPGDRVFRWALPIVYPPEITTEAEKG